MLVAGVAALEVLRGGLDGLVLGDRRRLVRRVDARVCDDAPPQEAREVSALLGVAGDPVGHEEVPVAVVVEILGRVAPGPPRVVDPQLGRAVDALREQPAPGRQRRDAPSVRRAHLGGDQGRDAPPGVGRGVRDVEVEGAVPVQVCDRHAARARAPGERALVLRGEAPLAVVEPETVGPVHGRREEVRVAVRVDIEEGRRVGPPAPVEAALGRRLGEAQPALVDEQQVCFAVGRLVEVERVAARVAATEPAHEQVEVTVPVDVGRRHVLVDDRDDLAEVGAAQLVARTPERQPPGDQGERVALARVEPEPGDVLVARGELAGDHLGDAVAIQVHEEHEVTDVRRRDEVESALEAPIPVVLEQRERAPAIPRGDVGGPVGVPVEDGEPADGLPRAEVDQVARVLERDRAHRQPHASLPRDVDEWRDQRADRLEGAALHAAEAPTVGRARELDRPVDPLHIERDDLEPQLRASPGDVPRERQSGPARVASLQGARPLEVLEQAVHERLGVERGVVGGMHRAREGAVGGPRLPGRGEEATGEVVGELAPQRARVAAQQRLAQGRAEAVLQLRAGDELRLGRIGEHLPGRAQEGGLRARRGLGRRAGVARRQQEGEEERAQPHLQRER